MNELLVNFQIGANKETINHVILMHKQIEKGTRDIVNNAIHIGKVLIELKKQCKHGEWMPLLNNEFGDIGQRRCNTYMAMARNPELMVNVESVREATRVLEKHDEKGASQIGSSASNLKEPKKPERSKVWDSVYINEAGEDKRRNGFLEKLDKLKDDSLRIERCSKEIEQLKDDIDFRKRIMSELKAG